jgi:hypothetical protein
MCGENLYQLMKGQRFFFHVFPPLGIERPLIFLRFPRFSIRFFVFPALAGAAAAIAELGLSLQLRHKVLLCGWPGGWDGRTTADAGKERFIAASLRIFGQ